VSDDAAIVLQARMGSRRLPGKSLAPVAGRTMLEHCIERLRASSGLRVVLATTTRGEDDCIVREGERLGVEVIRGQDQDVLGRFVMVAERLSLTEVVRATADNPAVDIDAPRRVLELRRATGADYMTERGLPYGTAVEAISTVALLQSSALTTEAADREHVTRFACRAAHFRALQTAAPPEIRRPDLRLTVDTQADLDFVRAVFEEAEAGSPRPVPLAALIAAADRRARTAIEADIMGRGAAT
jgi:spore coat polysaccharide biosynthesis protein SpsF